MVNYFAAGRIILPKRDFSLMVPIYILNETSWAKHANKRRIEKWDLLKSECNEKCCKEHPIFCLQICKWF